MIRRAFVLVCIAALPLAAWGQLLANVKLEPQEIKPGASVKITVNFDVTGGINCGLRVHFGDGNTQDYKVNQKKDVPLVVTRQYAQAGEYRVKAEPKTIGLLGGCGGRNQETVLKVVAPPAPPPVAAAPAPAAQKTAVAAAKPAAASQCPQDWTVVAKSVNRKTGAFTCTAKAGTKLPEGRLSCPGDLSYFENAKKRQLGCRS